MVSTQWWRGVIMGGVIVVMVTRGGRGALPGEPPALGTSASPRERTVSCWVPGWLFPVGWGHGPVHRP